MSDLNEIENEDEMCGQPADSIETDSKDIDHCQEKIDSSQQHRRSERKRGLPNVTADEEDVPQSKKRKLNEPSTDTCSDTSDSQIPPPNEIEAQLDHYGPNEQCCIKKALVQMYHNEISHLNSEQDAGKAIIDFLGGVPNILLRLLFHRNLDQEDLYSIQQILATSIPTRSFIPSTLFSHFVDQAQYQAIFNVLQCCMSQMPSEIIKEISECSVGNIQQCDNFEKCQNEFCILQDDYAASTQLDFDESDKCDRQSRRKRAKRAARQIGFFQCLKKVFCKQCIKEHDGWVEECSNYGCRTLCCTDGFHCRSYACFCPEYRSHKPSCNSCLVDCSFCGRYIGVLGRIEDHQECHEVKDCTQCGESFCPGLFEDNYGHASNDKCCPKCSLPACKASDI